MKTILCVEDELSVLANNQAVLSRAGYDVLTAENLREARERLARAAPDAIVLDIMLPDGNGLDFLKELRSMGSRIPIIMLTAWNKSADIARGLAAGANDYLGKPFEYDVLLARLEAMFRNVGEVPEILEKPPLKLNIVTGQAFLDGADMLLTQKEFTLMLLFMRNEGRAMSAEYLYEKVWRLPRPTDNSALKSVIYRLRKKLQASKLDIHCSRRDGYTFIR
jgi:DNA-binding response OmpR family regulator